MRRIGYVPVLLFSAVSGYGQTPPSVPSPAAKNILAFTIGGEVIPDYSLAEDGVAQNRAVSVSSSYALDLAYGRLLRLTARHGELWLDVPALVGPSHRLGNGDPLLPTSLATFYVTPSIRFAFRNQTRFTPWLSAGGGYGLFETSDYLAGGSNNATIHTHTGFLQFGGGIDTRLPIKFIVPLGLRGEFRDFYALSTPISPAALSSASQHGLATGLGLTARF